MANTPQNIYLNEISTTALTTIISPSTDETYTNLWLVVRNRHTSALTFTILHNDGSSDIEIITKTIPNGKQVVITELSGVKINDNQLLKIQSNIAGTYTVDLSGSIIVPE